MAPLHKIFSSNVKFLVILPSPPIRTPHRERLVIWMKRMVVGYIFVSGNSSIVVCGMAGLVFRRCFCRLPRSLCSGLQGYRRIQPRHSIQYRSPMSGSRIDGAGLARMLEAQSSLLRCCNLRCKCFGELLSLTQCPLKICASEVFSLKSDDIRICVVEYLGFVFAMTESASGCWSSGNLNVYCCLVLFPVQPLCLSLLPKWWKRWLRDPKSLTLFSFISIFNPKWSTRSLEA